MSGYVKVYIVLPANVFGMATGKLVELGVQHRHSVVIPLLTNTALMRGQGGIVGEGKNIMPNVHIDDRTSKTPSNYKTRYSLGSNPVGELYIGLYNAIHSDQPVGHGREGFYFGENGERCMYDICKAICEVLVDMGKGKSPEPTKFTKEEINKYLRVSISL